MADSDLQNIMDRLLGELKSDDASRCLQAIEELSTLNASSKAILHQLERLALSGNADVQSAAVKALSLRTSQFVASQSTTRTKFERSMLIAEINDWQKDGLLDMQRAEILRRRYDFDNRPAAPLGAPVIPQVQPQAVPSPAPTSQEAVPPPQAPRASLTQTLLSEASIRIYLYLGAFFVIASALILAAVVEAARLPILLIATIAFGGGALLLRKRLPQPSFALFIVFSFLLPIDANVLEETIGLNEPVLSIYWTIVLLLMAGIWSFSVWYYDSSFFSAVAFVALSLGFYRTAQIFDTEPELSILMGILASIVGLGGTFILKKWKDNRFSLPVFLLAQLQAVGLLLVSLGFAILQSFASDLTGGWWLLVATTWIAAAAFFAVSDLLFPFVLFPWMAVSALLPIPWFFLNTFEPGTAFFSIGFWVWAALSALLSEVLSRLTSERLRKYHAPLLAGSVFLFFISIVIALAEDSAPLIFAVLAGTAMVYAALHLLRPRWYVWSLALLGALAAYIAFFPLPFIEKLDVPILYQMLGACILLTVPELFARSPLSTQNQSRLPLLVFGALLSLWCLTTALLETENPGMAAIVFLTFAVLLTLYAFHFNRPWLVYLACVAESLAVVYGLNHFEWDAWLPALTLLHVLYYATGFVLRRRNVQGWGDVLINSGLALGAVLSLSAVLLQKETSGWYIIIIALLFLVEVFARPLAWLEVFVEALLSLALFRVITDLHVSQPLLHFVFGASLIWLLGDLLFGRLVEKRVHRPITLGIGYLLLVASTVTLLASGNEVTGTIYFVLYALFFSVYAFVRREPLLGYFVTAFIPLATIQFWDVLNFEKWIFPLILLAVVYYLLGVALRRSGQLSGWDATLLHSGLGLGVLTSIASPFQGGLAASIPVAIAATLFAVEAFTRRNVWWALPANALYLMSYFMILSELDVDQPQFYSIGAALLGMLMNYLLTRAGSKVGAFIAGMLSQLVLLGTTYIQMVSTNELMFFFVLFIQSMVVLFYGLILRSRSLVITPIIFAVLGSITVVYSALKGLSTVILIGCTGVVLLVLGIVAVILRERITRLGEQLSDWKP